MELGASAGLNQNWDKFNYQTAKWSRSGGSDITIEADWQAAISEHLDANVQIESRKACDLATINVSDIQQVQRLKCYTWLDQFDRLNRLEAAINLARETGVSVDRANAADWLEARLLDRPAEGTSVVFHSVFLIYPPHDQIARIMAVIRRAGEAAGPEAPLAWLSYESEALFGGTHVAPSMQARLQTWPGGEVDIYARSDGHVTRARP